MPLLTSPHRTQLKKRSRHLASRHLAERALSFGLCVFINICAPALLMRASSPKLAWAQSDVELLLKEERGEQKEGQPLFKSTPLLVWPVVDLRPLFEGEVEVRPPSADAPSDEKKAPLQAPLFQEGMDEHTRLTIALSRYQNLELISADSFVKEPRERAAYEQLLSLARGFARRGVQSYREVELKQAQAQLESALELFEQAKHHGYEPREVAQTHLTLGLVALERAQALRAVMAFREALLLNPRLRLSASLDGAEATRRFEEARAQLTSLPHDELTRLAERAHHPQRTRERRHLLSLWRTPQGLSSALSVWRGEHLEHLRDEALGAPKLSSEALSALAARLWVCLPFSRPQNNGPLRALEVDSLMSALSFMRSPVSFTLFRGFESQVSVPLVSPVSLLVSASWHVSARDQREDLRADVHTYALSVTPRWRFGRGDPRAWQAHLSLGMEARHLSEVLITREVGCKFFELKPSLPPQLCQASDLSHFEETWAFGARLEGSLYLPLRGALHLTLKGSLSSALYELSELAFEVPLSLGVGLGYGFPLRGR